MPVSDTFKESLAEWTQIKIQITEGNDLIDKLRDEYRDYCEKNEDLKSIKKKIADAESALETLRNRELSLGRFVSGYMNAQKIDRVELKGGNVQKKISVRKPTLTKKILMDELPKYIEGGEERLKEIVKLITESLEPKETEKIDLKLKKKPKK